MALAPWLLLLAALQDSRIERLIAQLDDERIEVREAATVRLAEIGAPAMEALRSAAGNGPAERRERIAAILTLIQEFADAAPQRASKLGIVTVDVDDVPLSELARLLEPQLFVPLGLARGVDPAQRVSLRVRGKPINEALEALGLACGAWSTGAAICRANRRGMTHTEGFSIRFERQGWPEHRRDGRRGFQITPVIIKSFDGDVEFDIVTMRSNRDIPFETCPLHRSAAVLVREPDLEELRIVLRGTRRWYRGVDVKFDNPVEGDSKRIGRCEVSLRWPNIVVRADREISPQTYHRLLRFRVRHNSKAGVVRGSSMPLPGCGGPARMAPGPTEWCDHCRGMVEETWPPSAKEHVIPTYTTNPLSDFESIEFTLRIPVEERFEVVSPPVK